MRGNSKSTVKNNVVDPKKVAQDAAHSDWPGALYLYSDYNNTIESNTAGYISNYEVFNSVYKNNEASSVRSLVFHECSPARSHPRCSGLHLL